jgi:hypothetical protein
MKVTETHRQLFNQHQKKVEKVADGGGDFQKMMEQLLPGEEKSETDTLNRPAGPVADGVQILQGTAGIEKSRAVNPGHPLVEEIRQTLDLVDFYAAKLGNDSLRIQDMSSLVGHLEDRLTHLRAMENHPGLPEKLKPIVSDLLVTVGAEIAKYRRGDYA